MAGEEDVAFRIPFTGLRTTGLQLPCTTPGYRPAGSNLLGYPPAIAPSSHFPGATMAMNVGFTREGGIYQRLGFGKWTNWGMATTDKPSGLYDYKLQDGTTQKLLATTVTSIYNVPPAGAWQALKTGLTGDRYSSFITYRNKCVIANGKDAPQLWDGTSASTGNLVQKIWATMTALPVGQCAGTCWSMLDDTLNRVNMASGRIGASVAYNGLFQSYDPLTGTWTTMPAGPAQDQNAGGAFEETAYVCGGYTAAAAHTSVNVKWDAPLGVWAAVKPMTAAKNKHGVFVAQSGDHLYMYECGGNTAASEAAAADSATCNQYNDLTDTWVSRGAMVLARRGLAAFELGGRGWAVGGKTGNTGAITYRGQTESYDPAANAWTNRTALTTARAQLGAASGANGKGYAVGGYTGADSAVVEELDPSTFAWTTLTGGGVLTAARDEVRCCRSGLYVYAPGGAAAGVPATTHYRLNTSAAAPICRWMAVYKDRIFFWGDPNAPNCLYYMEAGEYDAYDTRFIMRLEKGAEGDWATGIRTWRDELYCLRRKTIVRVTGSVFDPDPAVGDQQPVYIAGEGTVNGESVVEAPDGLYWRGVEGFIRFDGQGTVNISQYSLEEQAPGATWSDGLTGVYCRWAEEIRWYPAQAYASTINTMRRYTWTYHVPTGQWAMHDHVWGTGWEMNYGMLATAGDRWGSGGKSEIITMTSSATMGARIWRMDCQTNDSGEPFMATWASTPFSPGGTVDAYRLNRVLVEVAGWPGATLKCAVQGDDPTGVMAIAREMTGSNKSFQAGRWERDGIGAVGAAFIVRLDWDGGSVRSPLSNLQAFVKMQGKGHQ